MRSSIFIVAFAGVCLLALAGLAEAAYYCGTSGWHCESQTTAYRCSSVCRTYYTYTNGKKVRHTSCSLKTGTRVVIDPDAPGGAVGMPSFGEITTFHDYHI